MLRERIVSSRVRRRVAPAAMVAKIHIPLNYLMLFAARADAKVGLAGNVDWAKERQVHSASEFSRELDDHRRRLSKLEKIDISVFLALG